MRLIGTLTDPDQAHDLCAYLIQEGLESRIEVNVQPESEEPPAYQLWVIMEEDVKKAQQTYKDFKKDPSDPRFLGQRLQRTSMPPPPPPLLSKKKPSRRKIKFPQKRIPRSSGGSLGPVTLFFLLTCVALFFASVMTDVIGRQDNQLSKRNPIHTALQFDYPDNIKLRAELTERYGERWVKDPNGLPDEGKVMILTLNRAHTWKGLYDEFLLRWHNPSVSWAKHGKLFERVREGEIYRLFTPCLLHGNIFHIFFNMAWLIILGNQVERRLGKIRCVALFALLGIGSNVLQYLMGGYNFLGFSGIVCGLLGFIWMRRQVAAWEGYFLQPGTIAFVSLFILALAIWQTYDFIGALRSPLSITRTSGVANTAHIGGALIGLLLGRLPFFSWHGR